MDQAITRAAGAAPRAVGEFQGYVDGANGLEPSVRWLDRKNMPQVGDRLFAISAHAAAPRSWAILLTSANHGTVGPVGSTFPHAGEHHERVVVVEVPAGAGAPSDEVNLVLRAAPTAQDEPDILPDWISYDAVEHTLTIHGTVYSAELFRNLGIAPVGETFTISARENSVLTLLRPAPAAAQAGQVAPTEDVRNAALDEAANLAASCDKRATPRGIAVAIRQLKSAQASTSGERQEGGNRG